MNRIPFMFFCGVVFFAGTFFQKLSGFELHPAYLLVLVLPGFQITKLIVRYIKAGLFVRRKSQLAVEVAQQKIEDYRNRKIESLASYYAGNTEVPENLLDTKELIAKAKEKSVDCVAVDPRSDDGEVIQSPESKPLQLPGRQADSSNESEDEGSKSKSFDEGTRVSQIYDFSTEDSQVIDDDLVHMDLQLSQKFYGKKITGEKLLA